MRTDDRNGRHRDDIVRHHDDCGRHHDLPLRLDKEDKKKDQEETDKLPKGQSLWNKGIESDKETVEPTLITEETPFDPYESDEETQEGTKTKPTSGLFDPKTIEKLRRSRALSQH